MISDGGFYQEDVSDIRYVEGVRNEGIRKMKEEIHGTEWQARKH